MLPTAIIAGWGARPLMVRGTSASATRSAVRPILRDSGLPDDWPATRSGFSRCTRTPSGSPANRSEEHTSELQSLRHLVCRLLLEKKKNDNHFLSRQKPSA